MQNPYWSMFLVHWCSVHVLVSTIVHQESRPRRLRGLVLTVSKVHGTFGWRKSLAKLWYLPEKRLQFRVWYSAKRWGGGVGRGDFCYFKVTQPLTVSTVLTVDCKGERRKIPPSQWFKKSIQKPQRNCAFMNLASGQHQRNRLAFIPCENYGT